LAQYWHSFAALTDVYASPTNQKKSERRFEVEAFRIGEQRRLSFRIKIEWPVRLKTTRGLVEGKTRDISAGGAHIRCEKYLELNEPLHMIIEPPDREPMELAAVVIWSDSKDESNRPRIIGVKFTEMSDLDQHYLEQVALEEFKARLPAA
jgi:c-di-GMP-binding flagellar brake protein YcgR